MTFTLEPAAPFACELNRLLIKSSFDIANEWFFYDGAFSGGTVLEQTLSNTWLHENFIAVSGEREIFAYFEGQWSRPMDIITGFRTINFNKKLGKLWIDALCKYLDYLFVNRGCAAFNWSVALQNKHALMQYERMIEHYCGHKVGLRSHAQKSYTGKISDIILYELTKEEYFEWKKRGFSKKE
ncbi:MAG: hypothetical protein LBB48_02430 [Treponema sp.]|jgi:hypothetical protein|nr:hypothetical protein [Treponema sp.]